MAGVIDYDDGHFQSALDDYLQEEKDRILVDGTVYVAKGCRTIPIMEDPDVGEITPEFVQSAVKEQEKRQEEYYEFIQEYNKVKRLDGHLNGANRGTEVDYSLHNRNRSHREHTTQSNGVETVLVEDDLTTCQEYLAEVKIEEEWDCESILSTYSILNNHPTLITNEIDVKTSNMKNKKKSRSTSSGGNSEDGVSVTSNRSNASHISFRNKLPQQIILKGKHNLPISQIDGSFYHLTNRVQGAPAAPGSSNSTNVFNAANQQLITNKKKLIQKSINKLGLQGNGSTSLSTVIEASEDESEEEDDEDEEDEELEEEEKDGAVGESFEKVSRKKRASETPEEKKARKAAAKQAKQARKLEKKQTKRSFKEESSKLNLATAKSQDINNVSVFKFTH